MLHISEVAEHRIADVRDELKEGDQVSVKVLAVEGEPYPAIAQGYFERSSARRWPGPAAETVQLLQIACWRRASRVPVGSLVIEGGGIFRTIRKKPNFNREGGAPAAEEIVLPAVVIAAADAAAVPVVEAAGRRGRGGRGGGGGGGGRHGGGGHGGGGGGRHEFTSRQKRQ